MKNQRKSKYIFLYMVLAFSLLWGTSCSRWLVTPTPETENTPEATLQATPTSLATASPTPNASVDTPVPQFVTLRIWVPDFLDPLVETTGASMLQEQLYAYSDENYNTQTQIIAKKDTGPGGLYNLLSTAYDAAPAVLPDLIVLNQSDLRLAAENGYILPLDGYELPTWDYFKFSVDAVTLDETLYGIPYLSYAEQIIYREGITTTAPISWTDVISGGYSVAFPAAADLDLANDALLAMYIGSGGQVMDAFAEPSLDRSVLEEVYGFFSDLMAQGLIDAERALLLSDSLACWDVYREGLVDLSPVPVGLYWQQADEGSQPGWVPTQAGDPALVGRTWSLAVVTADGYRYMESIRVAEYLSSPLNQGNLASQVHLVPTRRQGVASWGLLPDETDFLNTLLNDATLAYPTSVDTSVRRALQAGLVAILRQDVETPEQAATYALTNLRR